MAGYTRQSVADIIANAVIKAAPVNAEYNAIRDAFTHATGHKHDGSSTEGAYVPLIADVDAYNKVSVDTTNNRISFFVQVGSGTVEQLRIQDGAFVPVTDNDIDLGASGAEFKDLFIDGVGYIDTLTVHENATIAGTLGVTGLSTLASVDINAGNIDGTIIGAASKAAASVTSLVADTADINAGTVDATIGGTTPAAGTFTSLVATTADINAGTIDATIIGATTPAAATVTSLVATTADINAGTIDDATIGASTPTTIVGTTITGTAFVGPITGAVTGNVTGNVSGNVTGNTAGVHTGAVSGNVTGNLAGNVTSTGTNVLATVDIGAGSIDGTAIGAASASTVVGTTVTATNFVGPVAGAVTGNVTGNTAGVHTGAVTGDVAGNVTSSGTSAFANVTISGSLDMNAGTSATVTGLSNPVQGSDAATKTYVDAEVAAVLDAAPGALDTLNELAAALGDDANYAATTTTALATKLPKAGGTMTGAIAMGTSKITGLGAPTAGTDATTKTYVDAGEALKVSKAGDTMSGVLAMGANKITGVANPTLAQDVVTKDYSDTLFGSTTAAATSASNAATSETNAATSATNSLNSANSSAASLATFTGQYVSQSGTPSSPGTGDLWFDTGAAIMKVYNGSGWVSAGSAVSGTNNSVQYTATAGQTTFTATYDAGYLQVYLNGIRLDIADYTATNGSSVILGAGAAVNDVVFIHSFGTFLLADHYSKTVSDARFLGLAGGTMTGDTLHGDSVKAKFGTGGDLEIYHDGSNSHITDEGTGDLYIKASSAVRISNADGSEKYAVFNENGATNLYYDNAKKLATTSTGIDVTGTVTSDGLGVSGNSSPNVSVTSTGGSVTLWSGADDAAGYVGTQSNHPLVLRTNQTERMRIDSSGNVLVGTTDAAVWSNTTGIGINLRGDLGLIASARTNAESAIFNRMGTDGDIVKFNKDGTTVGSIGVAAGDNIYFAGGAGSTKGIYINNIAVYPADTGGGLIDAAVALGSTSTRWKDLYLSGGVYLGGTGSANKLDDYEEGTWTPTLITGSASMTSATYTKVGSVVTLNVIVHGFSNRTTAAPVYIQGLPFPASNGENVGSTLCRYVNLGNAGFTPYISSNTMSVYAITVNGNYAAVNHSHLNSTLARFYISVQYSTTS